MLAIPPFVGSALVAFAPFLAFNGDSGFKFDAAVAQVRALKQALDLYKADCGKYPTHDQGLAALVRDPNVSGWRGPYLQKDVPLDPWHRPYAYDTSIDPPAVISYGAGGKRGGSGSDVIVSSNDPHPERVYVKHRPPWMFVAAWIGSVFVLVGLPRVLLK